MGCKFLRLKPN